MIKVYPAILTDDLDDFRHKLKQVKFAKFIQIDIMDGKFVKNKSLMPKDIKKIKIAQKVEYHLMIKNPENKIDEFLKLKPFSIIIHYESTKKLDYLIKKIKSKKVKIGIAINPETKIEKVFPYLKKIDSVLVMAVHPGFYHSRFTPTSLDKIRRLRKKTKLPIEIDGHEDEKTCTLSTKAGANILISGSYIFNNNPKKAYKRLLNINSRQHN